MTNKLTETEGMSMSEVCKYYGLESFAEATRLLAEKEGDKEFKRVENWLMAIRKSKPVLFHTILEGLSWRKTYNS